MRSPRYAVHTLMLPNPRLTPRGTINMVLQIIFIDIFMNVAPSV